jgi:hypothetical protein
MGRECTLNGKKRTACKILVRKPSGKKQLRRRRRMWVENIKIDNIREIGWSCMDWIELAHDRDQWRAHENETSDPTKYWQFLE